MLKNLTVVLIVVLLNCFYAFAQEIYEAKDGRRYKIIKKTKGEIHYEEIYEGVKKFTANVKTNKKSISVEDLVFYSEQWSRPYPMASYYVVKYWYQKSLKVKVDEAKFIIPFKKIDQIRLFWNTKNRSDSVIVYMKTGKKVRADFICGYLGSLKLKGKVYNELLEEYSMFDKDVINIESLKFETNNPGNHENQDTEADSIDWNYWNAEDFDPEYGKWMILDDGDEDIAVKLRKKFFYDTTTSSTTTQKWFCIDISIRALKGEVTLDAYRWFLLEDKDHSRTIDWLIGVHGIPYGLKMYDKFNPKKLKRNPEDGCPSDIITVAAAKSTAIRRTLPFMVAETNLNFDYIVFKPEFIGPIYLKYGHGKAPITNFDWEEHWEKRNEKEDN